MTINCCIKKAVLDILIDPNCNSFVVMFMKFKFNYNKKFIQMAPLSYETDGALFSMSEFSLFRMRDKSSD